MGIYWAAEVSMTVFFLNIGQRVTCRAVIGCFNMFIYIIGADINTAIAFVLNTSLQVIPT